MLAALNPAMTPSVLRERRNGSLDSTGADPNFTSAIAELDPYASSDLDMEPARCHSRLHHVTT